MQSNISNMTIRTSSLDDLPQMKRIFASARQFMVSTGNPNQWAADYPSDSLLREDIESGTSHVVVENGNIVATFVLRSGNDPTYDRIYQGAWPNNEPYATIHRIASNGQAKGIFHLAVCHARQHCRNIRIDTHRDNIVMQHAIMKEGFRYCGVIHCWNGSERLAYQLVGDKE